MSFASAFSNYNPQYMVQGAQQVAAAPATPFAAPGAAGMNMPNWLGGSQGAPSLSQQLAGYNSAANVAMPGGNQGNGFTNWLKGDGNLAAVAGIGQSLVGAFLGWKQLQHAKDQLNFQKEAYNTNMANSIQSYNTSLEDRIRGRSANPNESDVQNYLNRHSLKRQK